MSRMMSPQPWVFTLKPQLTEHKGIGLTAIVCACTVCTACALLFLNATHKVEWQRLIDLLRVGQPEIVHDLDELVLGFC